MNRRYPTDHAQHMDTFTTVQSAIANLPELLTFWRAMREKHFVIIEAPDERFVQLLVDKEGMVVCEVVADHFLDPDQHWRPEQLTKLARHFDPPEEKGSRRPNWIYTSDAPEAAMEASRRAAFALTELLELRLNTLVSFDVH